MTSETDGYATGAPGIWRTYNGGRDWIIRPGVEHIVREFGSREGLFTSLHTADGKAIWVVGYFDDKSVILASKDGGKTWRSQAENVRLPEGVSLRDFKTRDVFATSGLRATVVAKRVTQLAPTTLHT